MNGVERLHYFNGQRLVARDLEIEQRYFITVRRMLNRGLYSPGVVDGLEVSKVDGRHVAPMARHDDELAHAAAMEAFADFRIGPE